jgi:GH24 family phage-related lysozyme (muramidase)
MDQNTKTVLLIGGAAFVGFLLLSQNANATAGAVSPSQNAINYIINAESFSPTAYADPPNQNTTYSIGYGHQIQPGENYLMSATIDQTQALQFLNNDLAPLIVQINNAGLTFTQGQFDAAIDLGYNAGPGALNGLIFQFVNNGPDAVAAWLPNHYITINKGTTVLQSLINRRNDEVNTWNN